MPGVSLAGLPNKMKDYALKENTQILTTLLIDGLGFLDYMALIDEVIDEIPLTQMYVDSVLQPGNKDDFTPKGTANFKARIGKVRSCKIDFRLTPKQITAMWKSYIGKIRKSSRDNVYSVPFQQEIFNLLIAKAKSELRLNALFKGKYDPDKVGAGAVDMVEGLLRIFAGSTNGGGVPGANIFAGAPITQSNAIDQFEGVADKVADEYIQQDLICLASPTALKMYNRDYRTTFGGLNYNNEYKKLFIDGTNIELIGEPGLSGTHGIFITTRENLAWLADSTAKADSVIVETSHRNVDVMVDFECAPEMAIAELVWCNDIALPAL